MSERPVEDQIMDESRLFLSKLGMLARQHALAGNWLERRKVRREISLAMREQRRNEAQARQHQIAWTNQMIDRYRAHALAVEIRRFDPMVDGERKARDAKALAEHTRDLKWRVLANTRLTEVERGIALDAVEMSREDPRWNAPRNVLAKAKKARGTEALRYRVEVARTARELGVDRHTGRRLSTTAQQAQAKLARSREDAEIKRIDAEQSDQRRYRGLIGWTAADGSTSSVASQFPTERAAIEWMQRTVDYNRQPGGQVMTLTQDLHNGALQYSQFGNADFVVAKLADREEELRERMRSGRVHLTPYPTERKHTAERTQAAPAVEQTRSHHEGSEKLAEELASLKQRHHLSIEHNANLADRNATLTRELTSLRAEREQLLAERDRFKTERDEAVQRIARSTPARDRYGSRERRSAAASSAAVKEVQDEERHLLGAIDERVSNDRAVFVKEVRRLARDAEHDAWTEEELAKVRTVQAATDEEILAAGVQRGRVPQTREERAADRRQREADGNAQQTHTQNQVSTNAFAGLSTNAFAAGREQKGMSR